MEKFLANLTEIIADFGLKLLIALLIVVVGTKLTSVLVRILTKTKGFKMIEAGIAGFIKSIVKILLYILIFITAASVLGIPTTSFLTMLASAGLAIGLALQGSLSNFAGGLMLLFFKPFKVGDFINVCGKSGSVKTINVFYTTLISADNKTITIPNGTLANSEIENYSSEAERRVDMIFSVAYDADITSVKNILMNCAASHESVIKDKEIFAGVSAYKDNSVDFVLRVWCKNEHYWNVFFELNETVKKNFDESNIEIPFPQMDIHIKDNSGRV